MNIDELEAENRILQEELDFLGDRFDFLAGWIEENQRKIDEILEDMENHANGSTDISCS